MNNIERRIAREIIDKFYHSSRIQDVEDLIVKALIRYKEVLRKCKKY